MNISCHYQYKTRRERKQSLQSFIKNSHASQEFLDAWKNKKVFMPYLEQKARDFKKILVEELHIEEENPDRDVIGDELKDIAIKILPHNKKIDFAIAFSHLSQSSNAYALNKIYTNIMTEKLALRNKENQLSESTLENINNLFGRVMKDLLKEELQFVEVYKRERNESFKLAKNEYIKWIRIYKDTLNVISNCEQKS